MNLTEIIEAAKQATPGRWEVMNPDRNDQPVIGAEGLELATLWHHCVGSLEKKAHANARHIANCTPGRIIALCEFVQAFEAWCKTTGEEAGKDDMEAWAKLDEAWGKLDD